MKRRKWKPEQKALIVLEGLKGRPIGELCAEHEISQAQLFLPVVASEVDASSAKCSAGLTVIEIALGGADAGRGRRQAAG
jgi:transposase-like protein